MTDKIIKEFRSEFAEDTPNGILYWHGNAEEIEAFILKEVSRARAETIKEVEEMIDYNYGDNANVFNLKKKLSHLKGKK